jgi:dihydrofolate reductase
VTPGSDRLACQAPRRDRHEMARPVPLMGRLIVSTQMTLDGVIDVGEWYVADGEHDRAGKDQLGHASAVLLGRKTYEGLAAYWSPARSRLAATLVDELRFWVHPAVWGSGERPLQGEAQNRLRLLASEAFDSGAALLRYAPT